MVQVVPPSPGEPDLVPPTPPEKENKAKAVIGIKNKMGLKK